MTSTAASNSWNDTALRLSGSAPSARSSGTAPGEERVQLGDHCRALPDRRPHTLDRTGADVANGEDPLNAGLHRQQGTPVRSHVGARSDEALLVEVDAAAVQPTRGRVGASE